MMGTLAGGEPVRRLLVLTALCALAITASAAPAQAAFRVFEPTGAEQKFVVPQGVGVVDVLAIGGTGGSGQFSGGVGAEVTGVISVTPGQTLFIEVGGNGQSNGTGGFNGGGDGGGFTLAGGAGGGGGGGASDVRLQSRIQPNTLESRVAVAAGGGGGGGLGASSGGKGGNAGAPGDADAGGIDKGGGAGTELAGGAAGAGCNGGKQGVFGLGGGGAPTTNGGAGGGGGGGWYGGGGGGGGCPSGGGGGGGGSSLVPPGGHVGLSAQGPLVKLTYHLPPTIEILSPANGATFGLGQAVAIHFSCSAEQATVTVCGGQVADGAAIDTSTPGPHSVTVEAADDQGARSVASLSYTVVVPPKTTLHSHPKKTIKTNKKKVRVKFAFGSNEKGSRFECKLDKAPFAPCSSPKSYKVKRGSHKFTVRAVSAVAGADATPATFAFKVRQTG